MTTKNRRNKIVLDFEKVKHQDGFEKIRSVNIPLIQVQSRVKVNAPRP